MKNYCVLLIIALSVATASAETAATKNAASKGEALVATNASAEAQIDVYAIADPAEALEALRRKWPGVAERVTQSVMPNYTGRFRQLDLAQSWCAVDLAGRAKIFEDVALEGIRLKIEPPVWHYNLACALARQGKKEEAFAALERAVASEYNDAAHAREDEDLAPLRADPRFAKLMAMCGEIKRSWAS